MLEIVQASLTFADPKKIRVEIDSTKVISLGSYGFRALGRLLGRSSHLDCLRVGLCHTRLLRRSCGCFLGLRRIRRQTGNVYTEKVKREMTRETGLTLTSFWQRIEVRFRQ